MSRDPCDRLVDILERIDAARVAGRRMAAAEAASDDETAAMAFDAVLYDLLVIGEAIKALPDAWTSEHAEVTWSDAARMRDLLAHRYFTVRADVVRATVDEPLEILAATCVVLASEHCRRPDTAGSGGGDGGGTTGAAATHDHASPDHQGDGEREPDDRASG